jgi:cell division protein FtsW
MDPLKLLKKNRENMVETSPPIDPFFLQLTVVLILLGCAFITSASWHESVRYYGHPWVFIIKHFIAVVFGVSLATVLSFLHYRWWKTCAWQCVFVTLAALLLTIKFGVVSGGSRRWLALGFLNLQSSEFAKIFSALIVTKAIVERKGFFMAMLASIVMSLIVLKQPDLGTSILVMSGAVAAVFASGFNLVLMILGVSGCLALGVWQVMNTPYQMDRIKYWLNPHADPLGNGYNLIQSIKAIGMGGLWGAGLGASIQKLGPLPIAYADFIFAIVCEEIGFIGAVVVLMIFLMWILRAFYLVMSTDDEFARIFGFSIVIVFAMQVLINIGVATGLFPITGMTLPFVSFGGSSFLSVSLMVGILMNISRFSKSPHHQ